MLPKWVSGRWFFRDERMFLIPGDSPMGYRLPLDSLPWVSKTDYPYQHAHDPFAPPVPLRPAAQLRMQYDGEQRTLSVAARIFRKACAVARGLIGKQSSFAVAAARGPVPHTHPIGGICSPKLRPSGLVALNTPAGYGTHLPA